MLTENIKNGLHLIRFNAVLFAKRVVGSGRAFKSPLVKAPISSLSDEESDVDELETCAETRRLNKSKKNYFQ